MQTGTQESTGSGDIVQGIGAGGLVPVIALENADDAVPLCRALQAGGLCVAEITFRTKAAPEAIRRVAEEFPEFILGAGTVTTLPEVEAAVAAGARFAVAPGFNPRVVRHAQSAGLPFYPGVCTPTDIEAALECDCRLLKFFPASAMGGVATISALYAPYKHRGVRFIPTGGIDASNMRDYLAHPGVLAIGGSWFVAKGLLDAKDWGRVTELTRQAVEVAAAARS